MPWLLRQERTEHRLQALNRHPGVPDCEIFRKISLYRNELSVGMREHPHTVRRCFNSSKVTRGGLDLHWPKQPQPDAGFRYID